MNILNSKELDMSLEMKQTEYRGIPLLQLAGTLMDADALRFSQAMRNLVKTGKSQIGIEISDLEYIDSHGLGLIIYHSNTLKKDNRQLVLFNNNKDPRAYINKLIISTKLHIAFTIYSSNTQSEK